MARVLSIANQVLEPRANEDFKTWLQINNMSVELFSEKCGISWNATQKICKETKIKINPEILLKIFLFTGVRSLCPEIIELDIFDAKIASQSQENYLNFLDTIIGKVTTLTALASRLSRSNTMVGSLKNEDWMKKNGYKMEYISVMREKVVDAFNVLLVNKAKEDSPTITQIETLLVGDKKIIGIIDPPIVGVVNKETHDGVTKQIGQMIDNSGLDCRKCLTFQAPDPELIARGEKGYMLQLGSKIMEVYKHIKAINDLYHGKKLSQTKRNQYRAYLTYLFTLLFGEMQILIDEVPEVFRAIVDGWKLGLDDGGLAQDSYKGFCALFGEKPINKENRQRRIRS